MAKSHTRGALMPPSKQGPLQYHPIIPSQSICVKKKQEMSGPHFLNFSNNSGTPRFLPHFSCFAWIPNITSKRRNQTHISSSCSICHAAAPREAVGNTARQVITHIIPLPTTTISINLTIASIGSW